MLIAVYSDFFKNIYIFQKNKYYYGLYNCTLQMTFVI